MRYLVALLVLGALFVAARLAVPRLSATSVAGGPLLREGERRLADCPAAPNCQGSDASEASRRVEPWPMHGTGEETMAALIALIDAEGGQLVTREPDYLHTTFRSSLMGYTDDVELLVDEPSSSVRVRSASRLGHSDLGANRKRLERLRAAWDATPRRASARSPRPAARS